MLYLFNKLGQLERSIVQLEAEAAAGAVGGAAGVTAQRAERGQQVGDSFDRDGVASAEGGEGQSLIIFDLCIEMKHFVVKYFLCESKKKNLRRHGSQKIHYQTWEKVKKKYLIKHEIESQNKKTRVDMKKNSFSSHEVADKKKKSQLFLL